MPSRQRDGDGNGDGDVRFHSTVKDCNYWKKTRKRRSMGAYQELPRKKLRADWTSRAWDEFAAGCLSLLFFFSAFSREAEGWTNDGTRTGASVGVSCLEGEGGVEKSRREGAWSCDRRRNRAPSPPLFQTTGICSPSRDAPCTAALSVAVGLCRLQHSSLTLKRRRNRIACLFRRQATRVSALPTFCKNKEK